MKQLADDIARTGKHIGYHDLGGGDEVGGEGHDQRHDQGDEREDGEG